MAHQVATLILVQAGKAAITAKEHCKNQYMDLQMVQHIQYVPQDHLIVAAAVHVTKIAVMDAPVLLMALA